MDITKKIPLIDFSKVYLELDDVEYGRTDMLNKTYYDTYGVSYNYDSTKYMTYTIEAGVEFIFNIISICLECFCKNKI